MLELYAPVSYADHPARLFAVLRRHFSCDSYCYDEFIGTAAIRRAHTPELRLDTEVFNRYAAQHPSIEAIVRDQIRSSVKISDFKTLSQWRHTDLYNDFFRLEGLNYQLGYLALNEGPRLGLALNRTKRDFSEEERAMFDLLLPHFLQAFQTTQLFSRLSESAEARPNKT